MSAADGGAADKRVGFIGVGAMGSPMVRSLLRAGYEVLAFDLSEARMADIRAAGAQCAADTAGVVESCDIVLFSLPSSDAFVSCADSTLLPASRAGHVFIDFGTTIPWQTHRIGAALAERGASLIDAPVSGGISGAEKASLLMFVGGNPDCVERCRPILETVGGAQRLTYCGPSGAGQIVKGVNQLAMGLGAAAYLEAVAFGVLAGVDATTIAQAIQGPESWRSIAAQTAEKIASGNGESIGVKFRELPYYLSEAHEQDFALPLTELLYHLCDAGERVVTDDNRPAPAYWHRLQSLAADHQGKRAPQ